MKEKNYRSLVKSISYRITGTIATFLISLIVTGKIEFALSIMSVDFVSKIAIFYFHERMWNKIKFGKIKECFIAQSVHTNPILKNKVKFIEIPDAKLKIDNYFMELLGSKFGKKYATNFN